MDNTSKRETKPSDSSDFRSALSVGTPIIADGGTGTLLVEKLRLTELNRHRPLQPGRIQAIDEKSRRDAICAVHLDYLKAGARLIYTNTFAINAWTLRTSNDMQSVGDAVRYQVDILKAAVAKFSKSGSGNLARVFVGGVTGPLTTPNYDDKWWVPSRSAVMQEKLVALLESEIDVLVIETIPDVQEAKEWLQVVKRLSGHRELPPVMLTFDGTAKFEPTGINADAMSAHSAVVREILDTYPALSVLGINCGLDPQYNLEVLRNMIDYATTNSINEDLKLALKPNAGVPLASLGQAKYATTPEERSGSGNLNRGISGIAA